jgi:hypothetical protein
VDWITFLIELTGLVLLLLFIVVPIAEFRDILARLRQPIGSDSRRGDDAAGERRE